MAKGYGRMTGDDGWYESGKKVTLEDIAKVFAVFGVIAFFTRHATWRSRFSAMGFCFAISGAFMLLAAIRDLIRAIISGRL